MQVTKRKVSGGALAFVGYMLSPLSWWNDAFVNIPIALAFAWIVSLFDKPAFEAAFIVGYWLTNVMGFVLMQKGGARILSEQDKPYSWKGMVRDIVISLVYTLAIVAGVHLGIFQPIQGYAGNK